MSVAHYSIVRYVPDPVREEFVNVGVIVVSEDGDFRKVQMLDDWTRVERLTGSDTFMAKEITRELRNEVNRTRFNLTRLTAMSQNWLNCLQITEPRASIREPAKLLEGMYQQMVAPKLPTK